MSSAFTAAQTSAMPVISVNVVSIVRNGLHIITIPAMMINAGSRYSHHGIMSGRQQAARK